MRNLLKSQSTQKSGIIAIAAVIVFSLTALSLTGCGGTEDGKHGSCTITGLPAGHDIFSEFYVSSIADYQFINPSSHRPNDATWFNSLIGQGWREDYNKVSIHAAKFIFENGKGNRDITYMADFNYTGKASIHLGFQTSGGTDSFESFGINNVQFTNGHATIAYTELQASNNSGLTNEIDPSLIGTWKDELTVGIGGGNKGDTLTITFAADGITWGGTAGNTLNTATSAYKGSGYTFVWVAGSGTISYKYSGPGVAVQTVPVYKYVIESGKLKISAAATPGTVFATLVKD